MTREIAMDILESKIYETFHFVKMGGECKHSVRKDTYNVQYKKEALQKKLWDIPNVK